MKEANQSNNLVGDQSLDYLHIIKYSCYKHRHFPFAKFDIRFEAF